MDILNEANLPTPVLLYPLATKENFLKDYGPYGKHLAQEFEDSSLVYFEDDKYGFPGHSVRVNGWKDGKKSRWFTNALGEVPALLTDGVSILFHLKVELDRESSEFVFRFYSGSNICRIRVDVTNGELIAK